MICRMTTGVGQSYNTSKSTILMQFYDELWSILSEWIRNPSLSLRKQSSLSFLAFPTFSIHIADYDVPPLTVCGVAIPLHAPSQLASSAIPYTATKAFLGQRPVFFFHAFLLKMTAKMELLARGKNGYGLQSLPPRPQTYQSPLTISSFCPGEGVVGVANR